MSLDSTTPEDDDTLDAAPSSETAVLVLVVAWCRDEPWRVGEVLVVPPGNPGSLVLFGRGATEPGQAAKTLLGQLRPGQWLPSPPLEVGAISRYQFSARSLDAERIAIKNLGRCTLALNGRPVTEAEVTAGDLLLFGKQLLLLCARRHRARAPAATIYPEFAFGEPDANGIVGESQSIWHLRHQIAFIAARRGHVLIHGASGTGKELAARAIHALSTRGARPLVTRNAATLPENLIDAELFGNAKNYPNPGMLDRPGLIGEAHGSALLLDEFAELPAASQAHLLRVMDSGEYQRLGESKAKVSDFRLIAATNRDITSLKHDLLARFSFRLHLPTLSERSEDIPLLIRHIVRREALGGDAISLELFPGGDIHKDPKLPLSLVSGALGATLPANVRDLETYIWAEMAREKLGTERAISLPAAPEERASLTPAPEDLGDDSSKLTPEQVQRCLDENNGVIELTWRALGLQNRFVLQRLIRKHKLDVTKRPWKRKPDEE